MAHLRRPAKFEERKVTVHFLITSLWLRGSKQDNVKEHPRHEMSYDFYFWKEEKGAKLSPEKVIHELEDCVALPGIIGIPTTTVRQAFTEAFPDIEDGGSQLEWMGENSGFDVSFIFLDERTVSLGTICCGYGFLKEKAVMEKINKAIASLGCRLFDPQEPPPKPSLFKRLFS